MISKIGPLMILGVAAQSYYNKTKEGKKGKKIMKGDKNGDGKISESEKKIMEKAVLKKRMQKGKSDSSDTGDGTSAAQGKYGK